MSERFLSRSEITSSYAKIAKILDGIIDNIKTEFIAQGIQLLDTPNRTGFDWSGYPYYTWEICFRKDSRTDDFLRSYYLVLLYREPIEFDERKKLKVTIGAEEFYLGSKPLYKKESVEDVFIDENTLCDKLLKNLITEKLLAAKSYLKNL